MKLNDYSLLYYSHVDRVDTVGQKVDLDQTVREVCDVLGPYIEDKQAVVKIPQKLPTIQCDLVRIQEVFRNLIANGIKYNDKEKRWVEVGYIEKEPGGYVFYVKDNGIGIKKTHQKKIFSVFKKLHAEGEFSSGLGTGLAIVKKILEKHGGKIWLESKFKIGSCFYFKIC